MQKFELIVAIINRGFSDLVMDSAREQGATGGTILNARGTVVGEAQTIMGISIKPEKEIVLILTQREKRNDIMSAVCHSAGLNTEGKGIVFSLQVENVLGISSNMENFDEIIKIANNNGKEKHISKKKALKSESVKADKTHKTPKVEKTHKAKKTAKTEKAIIDDEVVKKNDDKESND